jgi:uncharacterized protein (DUF952 family)
MTDTPDGRDAAYHLVAESWYRAQPVDAAYVPEGFKREELVHLTHGLDEVIATGNRYYHADPRPYLLLTVDLNRLSSPVRYDDPDRRYPHVHGPLDCSAIIAVHIVERDSAGRFVALGRAIQHKAG